MISLYLITTCSLCPIDSGLIVKLYIAAWRLRVNIYTLNLMTAAGCICRFEQTEPGGSLTVSPEYLLIRRLR